MGFARRYWCVPSGRWQEHWGCLEAARCHAGGSKPCQSISERCFAVGSLTHSARGLMEKKNHQQYRARELGHHEFCPVGNMLESPSWKWNSEMKAKEGSCWEGWRMELRGMLEGCVYELVRAGERWLGVRAESGYYATN